MENQTRKVAYAVVLTALAVAGGVFLSIPVGVAIVSPVQAMVNVIAAVVLGPWYSVGSALAASIIRNALGRGTPNAFPGSMIGAFISSYIYVLTRNIYLAALGEVFGTGLLGSLVSIYFVVPIVIQKPVDAIVLSLSFVFSTIAGSIFGILGVLVLQRAGIVKPTAAESAQK